MGKPSSMTMGNRPSMKFHPIRDIFEKELKSVLKPALLIWAFFLAIWLFIGSTHLGFQHDVVGLSWGPPGTPVTFLQVVLVATISFIFSLGGHWIGGKLQNRAVFLFSRKDVLIFFTLWGLAVFLWSREPMSPTHFTPPPMPPNQETYPHSDALLFDRSSYHLLYGIGFADRLVRRPLYVGALALFHGIVGGNYDNVMFLQILILALMPAIVFLFTSRISNRMAGLIAGGLIILREKNSIALSGDIATSHAKLMMSDMISTLGVVLALYLAVRWLFHEKTSMLECMIVGASLGATALIRAQVVILLVPLLLVIFITRISSWGQALKSSIFVLLGLMLVMAPWLWRNWNLTGTFVLDDHSEERLLARNYSLSPDSKPPALPGETDEEFSARLKTDIFSFILSHPRDVAHFVSNHFLRNLATSAVYVAPNYSTDSPTDIIKHLPFWDDWSGTLTRNSGAALFINLGIIAFGIAVATSKNKWQGLFPLSVFLIYSLGNALVRSSGWRFNQPADWIMIVYFSIAVAYLPSKFKSLASNNASNQTSYTDINAAKKVIPQTAVLAVLFLLGASVPLAEKLIPFRSFDENINDARTRLIEAQIASADAITTFLKQKDAVLLSGVGLYPRYVQPNSRFDPLEESKEYRYLHVWLINESNFQIVLPLQSNPENIPHTALISVIGCQEKNYISALAIIVHNSPNAILLRDPEVSLTCPLPEPNN